MQNNRTIAALGAVSLLLTAFPALAQTSAPVAKSAAFCANVATISSKITANVDEREQKITDFRSETTSKHETRWSSYEQKLADIRAADDRKRAEQYAKLDAKAATDDKKAAVAEFKSVVDAAVVTRRGAVDAAIAAYRSGIDASIAANSSNLIAAQSAFKAAVDASIEKAKSDCASGGDSIAIRAAMRDSINAAQDAFKAGRKDGSLQSAQKELAATRKAAIDKAMADFRAALDVAVAELVDKYSIR